MLGPVCWYAIVSSTDLVNSGSYLTELLVVVRGITTFTGFGGSFFNTGFTLGLIETRDLGSKPPGFFATGFCGTIGFGAGLDTAFGAAAFLITGLAAFFGAGFF